MQGGLWESSGTNTHPPTCTSKPCQALGTADVPSSTEVKCHDVKQNVSISINDQKYAGIV